MRSEEEKGYFWYIVPEKSVIMLFIIWLALCFLDRVLF